jgi:predicted PP-loop superfamily ATPase
LKVRSNQLQSALRRKKHVRLSQKKDSPRQSAHPMVRAVEAATGGHDQDAMVDIFQLNGWNLLPANHNICDNTFI